MGGLEVVGGGVGVGCEVVVGVELDPGYVFLEERDRNGAWKFFAPSPDEVEAAAEDGREGVDVLIPGAVEVGEKKKIVVLELFLRLPLSEPGEALAGN